MQRSHKQREGRVESIQEHLIGEVRKGLLDTVKSNTLRQNLITETSTSDVTPIPSPLSTPNGSRRSSLTSLGGGRRSSNIGLPPIENDNHTPVLSTYLSSATPSPRRPSLPWVCTDTSTTSPSDNKSIFLSERSPIASPYGSAFPSPFSSQQSSRCGSPYLLRKPTKSSQKSSSYCPSITLEYRVVKFSHQWLCGEYDGQMQGDVMHGKGRFKYDNNKNDIYDGDWKDNRRHGTGIRLWPNGQGYRGEWENGEIHGKGTFKFVDGSVYEGEWEFGKREGRGTMRYPNGDVYDGEWSYGLRCGKGILTFANGDVYDGHWKEDKKHGTGILDCSDGRTYHGEWIRDAMDGKGGYKFRNGSIYQGEMHQDKMHGQGVMKYALGQTTHDIKEDEGSENAKNGVGETNDTNQLIPGDGGENGEVLPPGKGIANEKDTYDGAWKENQRHGQGLRRWPNGEEYCGEWENGEIHGTGVLKYPDGSVKYNGQWVLGRKEGKGIMRYPNGDVYDGEWIYGHRSGTGLLTTANGEVYDVFDHQDHCDYCLR